MGLDWIPANLILFFLLSLIGYAIFDRRWKQFWVNLGLTMPEEKILLMAMMRKNNCHTNNTGSCSFRRRHG